MSGIDVKVGHPRPQPYQRCLGHVALLCATLRKPSLQENMSLGRGRFPSFFTLCCRRRWVGTLRSIVSEDILGRNPYQRS
jgi:hypothetical protein